MKLRSWEDEVWELCALSDAACKMFRFPTSATERFLIGGIEMAEIRVVTDLDTEVLGCCR